MNPNISPFTLTIILLSAVLGCITSWLLFKAAKCGIARLDEKFDPKISSPEDIYCLGGNIFGLMALLIIEVKNGEEWWYITTRGLWASILYPLILVALISTVTIFLIWIITILKREKLVRSKM